MVRKTRVVLGVLLAAALLLLAAQLGFAWYFNTTHMRRRLEAAVAGRSDSLYYVRIASSKFNLLGRSFAITGFELAPDTAAFRRRQWSADRPEPHTRYEVRAAALRAGGIALTRFFRRQIWLAGIEADSLRLEILVDRTKPRGPLEPALLPHQVLKTKQPLRIDRIRLRRSEIRFSERAVDGSRFGTLPFTGLEAEINNVSNDPLRMSRARASEIDVRARFAGSAPLLVRFDYDLAAPRLNLSYRGSIGRMPAAALNAFLVSLEGIRIRDGLLDSADFQVDVRDDVARGRLLLLYHDLSIETLDKVSRHRGLDDVINTFIFNHFKLESSNPPKDKPPLRAALVHRRQPETPLFKFIWLTLRDGVFTTLGL